MEIYLFNHTFYPARGGIENYLSSLARVIREAGHQPTIVCRRHLPGLPEREEYEGITVIRHPDFSVPRRELFRKPLYLSERISRWLSKSSWFQPDLVICRHPYYQAALARLSPSPEGVYLPASILPRLLPLMLKSGRPKEKFFFYLWRKQIRRLEREALSSARVVVFSENMKKQVGEYYGLSPERVEVNPPGVDGGRFHQGEKDPELLQRFGLKREEVILLSLGRLSPEKNLIFLLKAITPLLRLSRARLLLVGEGPQRDELESKVSELGLKGKVILSGETEHPEDFYRLGDIFLSPSRSESFGQSLLEAMATGLPVVALKRSPPRILTAAEEIMDEGRSGYCLPLNEEDWAEVLERLADNPDLRLKLGTAGRSLALSHFRWQEHWRRILEGA